LSIITDGLENVKQKYVLITPGPADNVKRKQCAASRNSGLRAGNGGET
jgi:hypothetical protein